MKKLITLCLVVILSTSLIACGTKNNPEKEILGAWVCYEENDVLVFEEEGKLTRGEEMLDWWYDEDGERYCLSYYGMTFNFKIQEDDKGKFFTIEEMPYYYLENYNEEELSEQFRTERIAAITDGKTEMVVGNTYTTNEGIEFVFEKAGIYEGETDCKFELYLTSEDNISFDEIRYESANGWSGFGMGQYESEGNTTRYAGGFMEMERLKEDRDDYGFLTVAIGDSHYYIPIETFF